MFQGSVCDMRGSLWHAVDTYAQHCASLMLFLWLQQAAQLSDGTTGDKSVLVTWRMFPPYSLSAALQKYRIQSNGVPF